MWYIAEISVKWLVLDGYGQMLKHVVFPKSVLLFVCQVVAIMFLYGSRNEFPEEITHDMKQYNGSTNTVLVELHCVKVLALYLASDYVRNH